MAPPTISIFSLNSIGSIIGPLGGTATSITWPAANRAVFYPFRILNHFTAKALWITNGGTLSGNWDAGIYTPDGRLLISSGLTTQSGISNAQVLDIPNTLLVPSLYYVAFVLDNNTGQINGLSFTNAAQGAIVGMAIMNSASPLPPSASLIANTETILPRCGVLGTETI